MIPPNAPAFPVVTPADNSEVDFGMDLRTP